MIDRNAQFLRGAEKNAEHLKHRGPRPVEANTLALMLRQLPLQIQGQGVGGRPGEAAAHGPVAKGIHLVIKRDVGEVAVPLQHAA